MKKTSLVNVLAIVILSGWTVLNFQKQSRLHELRAEFEMYKVNELSRLQSESLDLENRRSALDENQEVLDIAAKRLEDTKVEVAAMQGSVASLEAQAAAKLRLVDEKEQNVASREQKVAQIVDVISPAAQRTLEENNIKRLMEEFSLLGVSLRYPPSCADVEAVGKYVRAKAILSQISTRARAIDLYNKYSSFLIANGGGDGRDCR